MKVGFSSLLIVCCTSLPSLVGCAQHSAAPRRAATVTQRETHYDANGRYTGYTEQRGTTRMHYDETGRWIGRSEVKR